MSFWTFVIAACALYAIVELIQNQADGARKTKLAKIEADLKRDLVERLQDPELVARVIEAKLPVREGEEAAPGAPAKDKAFVAMASIGTESSADEDYAGSGILLGGIICLLVGAAFLVLSGIVTEAFVIPGAIVTAVGLALLVYPSAREELSRSRRRRIQQQSATQESTPA